MRVATTARNQRESYQEVRRRWRNRYWRGKQLNSGKVFGKDRKKDKSTDKRKAEGKKVF